ncbi:MAG: DUF4115 domain-containing protein [Chromatiales bacterium]|jgi:cytoskeleton protein RodZ
MSALPKQETEAIVAELPKPKGPGARLKAARLAQRKEIDIVAAQLHLTHDMIVALEADDYEHLPARVFVLGYLKNYARHVGLPAEAIVQAFNNYLPPEDTQQPLPTAAGADTNGDILERGTSEPSHSSSGMVPWLVIVALFGLFIYWWQGTNLQLPENLQQKFSEMMESAATLGTQKTPLEAESQPEATTAGLPAEPVATIEEKPAAQITEQKIPEIIASPVATVDETAADSTSATEKVEDTAAAAEQAESADAETLAPASAEETAATEEAVAPTAPVEPALPAAKAEIVVNFTRDCWVSVKGANGSYRLLGVMPKGSSKTFEGEAPYKVLFGNAVAVKMSINGEPFDIKRFTEANVTKFTLEQSDINQY